MMNIPYIINDTIDGKDFTDMVNLKGIEYSKDVLINKIKNELKF
jgi:hypothetical protein